MTSYGKKPSSQFFRASVGAIISNGRGEVLAFERKYIPGAWQLPQGGLEEGEEPKNAILREIEEETGIKPKDLIFIREHPELLSYELPNEYRNEKTGRGQTQKWFLFKYVSELPRIELTAGGEFVKWKWMPLRNLIKSTVLFRKDVYRRLEAEFKELDDLPNSS